MATAQDDLDPTVGQGTAHVDRLERLRRDRPGLYASRHVVKALVQVVIGAVGVGALLWGLLPLAGWLEAIDPTWLRERLAWLPDPLAWAFGWIRGHIPAVTVPGWAADVGRSARWAVPVVIALIVAAHEVAKHRAEEEPHEEA